MRTYIYSNIQITFGDIWYFPIASLHYESFSLTCCYWFYNKYLGYSTLHVTVIKYEYLDE